MTSKEKKLLTDFYNYLKEQCPTYRIRDMNTDLLVQSFLLNRKQEQKSIITQIMHDDEQLGLYETKETPDGNVK
jgi:patatin-like phospholipase/acyl hydrolase